MQNPLEVELENAALRKELAIAREKLFHLDQLKWNFVALVAAELRNPIAVLMGYVGLLQEQSLNGTRENVNMVAAQAAQLKRLIDSIVLLQQLDSQQLRLHRVPVPLAHAANSALQLEKYEITRKSIRIENQIRPDLIVSVDRDLLSLILANLLANAIKFSPHQSRVTLAAQPQGNFIQTCVSDEGIGILPEEHRRIFERFYQVGDPLQRRFHGIGLGLAISKSLVELHGGRIWVESALNQGSTFYFTLPGANSESTRA